MVPEFEPILVAFQAARLTAASTDRTELEHTCVVADQRGWQEAATGNGWREEADVLARRYFRDELTPDVLESMKMARFSSRGQAAK